MTLNAGDFHPDFFLKILSRFLSEARTKQRIFFLPAIFSKDFFKIFSEDFKIFAIIFVKIYTGFLR